MSANVSYLHIGGCTIDRARWIRYIRIRRFALLLLLKNEKWVLDAGMRFLHPWENT